MHHTRPLLILLLTLFPSLTRSQWQLEPNVPDVEYFGVSPFDAEIIHGAGLHSLLRTVNGGTSWDTTFVTLSGLQFPCALYDVHFITSQIGVASGLMSLGSQYVMLRTTDAGANWNATYVSTIGGPIRAIHDIAFGSATEGFAVGTDGRLIRTTNGGQSWTALSPPPGGHLHAFQYGAGNVRHIAGNQRILRSTNGGTTWTTQYFSGHDLRGLHFPSPSRGYAVGRSGSFLRTEDGGLSWTVMPGPFGDTDLTDVHFTSDDIGHVTGGERIWRTTTGGLFWEWFPCVAEMRGIAFLEGDGVAVGDAGALYRTSNGTGGYHPIASFDIDPAMHCEDSLIMLTNRSAPGLSSTWYLNGQFLSNTTNASLVITEAQQVDTITLVVGNGSHTDTLEQLIHMAPSLNINVTAVLADDTLCQGGSTQVQVPGALPGVSYMLRRGNVQIGNTQSGNGLTLSFATGATNVPEILNVLAFRNVPGCGTGMDTAYVTIHNGTPATGLSLTPEPAVICPGDSSVIRIQNSELGVNYQLLAGAIPIGPPQIGNGGDVLLQTSAIQTSASFTVRATHPSGCVGVIPAVTVTTEQPTAHFTLDSWNPETGQVQSTYNTSMGSIAQEWSFGAGAAPTSSTESSPAVVFNTPGPRTVSLTVTSPAGCIAVHHLPIHVIQEVEGEACHAVHGFQMQGSYSALASVRFAPSGDVYLVTDNETTEEFQVHSGHLDTIADFENDIMWVYDHLYHLTKFNAQGVPQWMTRMRFGSPWAKLGDVVVDENDNSYLAFFHGDSHDSLYIYGTDGRHVRFLPPWDGSSRRSVVVVSWDAQGRYRWHRTFLEHYTMQRIRVELDGQEGVYVCGSNVMVKLDRATGEQMWSVAPAPWEQFVDLAVDQTGDVWVLGQEDLVISHYDGGGELVNTAAHGEELSAPGGGNSRINAREVRFGPDGDLFVGGLFQGRVRIGQDTLHDDLPQSVSGRDHFISRIDTQNGPEWAREMELSGDGSFEQCGLCVMDGHVLMLGRVFDVTCSVGGHPPVSIDDDHVLVHFDAEGGTPRLTPFPTFGAGTNNRIGTAGEQSHALASSAQGAQLAGMVGFQNVTGFSNHILTPHPSTYAGDFLLGIGEIECFVTTLPSSTATPISWFAADLPVCLGQTIQFQDASLNDPTSWYWTFEGGQPATSTSAAPVVTFSSVGSHSITLTTSNANGSGTEYNQSVLVEVCTSTSTPNTTEGSYGLQHAVHGDILSISAGAWTGQAYRITDMAGRSISSGRLTTTTTLDVSGLSSGTYMLLVTSTESAVSTRFVVLH